jgi:hypothetical protein
MTDTTLTLALNGDVPLDDFADGIREFWRLVNALTQEVSGKSDIAWFIDELTVEAPSPLFVEKRTRLKM